MKQGTRKLFDSIKFCNLKLNFVLEITQKILDNHPTEEILAIFSELLTAKLAIKQALFYILDDKQWKLKFSLGVNHDNFKDLDIDKVLGKYKDITMIRNSNLHLGKFDFVIPIFHKGKSKAYILIGDLDDDALGMSPAVKNLSFIQTIGNIIVVAVEKKKLILEAIERERMKKELETAAKIQKMLIPDLSLLPQTENTRAAAFYLPHYELGGDLYDFGKISEQEFYFAIADVSGKGLSAALIMSNFQANLRAQFSLNIPLEKIIRNLNETVIRGSKGSHFITLFLGKYNIAKKKLIYVNAGHHPPILYDKTTKKVELLKKGCVGIGMLDEIPKIEIGKVKITNPTKLVLYTDGAAEISSHNFDDFGFRKILQITTTNLDIKQTIDKIIETLKLSKDNYKLFDDVTLLGFEFL